MLWRTLASRQTTAQLKTSKENGCATAESRTKCRLVRPTQSFGAKNAKTTLTMQNSQNTTTKRCWFFPLIYCPFVAVILTSRIWRARKKHNILQNASISLTFLRFSPGYFWCRGWRAQKKATKHQQQKNATVSNRCNIPQMPFGGFSQIVGGW